MNVFYVPLKLRCPIGGSQKKEETARPIGRAAEAELVFGLLLKDKGVSRSEKLSEHEQVISAK
jgi:hypothetical protein